MANPADFPDNVWDGTSRTRPDFSVKRGPDGTDHDRISEEVRAVQRLLLGDGAIFWTTRDVTTNLEVLEENDVVVYLDATVEALNFTLGDPSTMVGRVIVVKRDDTSPNLVTLIATIDGIVNPTLGPQHASLMLQARATQWRIL